MIFVIVFMVALALAVWGAKTVAPDALAIPDRLGWLRIGVLFLAMLLLVMPFTHNVGDGMAVAEQKSGFHEFWNGSINSTGSLLNICGYDQNNCATYDCDPYEDGQWVSDYNSKGEYTGSHYEPHTSYHDCPYVTQETDYYVTDTFGDTTIIDGGTFDLEPVAWRAGQSIPDWQRGPSQRWLDYKTQVDAGDAPAVTKTNEYDNYVLASPDTLLKKASKNITKYAKNNLLPSHTFGVPENADPVVNFVARKFITVDLKNVQMAEWNDALMKFNAALGMGAGPNDVKQGDMHIIAVNADRIDNSRNYVNALVAYWQSPKFGKWGIPKNAIIVVLGVKNDKVVWSEAKTGMPYGNGAMLSAISGIRGDFDPELILGDVKTTIKGSKVIYEPSEEAAISKAVFYDHPFRRACMAKCDDKGDTGHGFIRLESEIVPIWTFWMYVVLFLVDLLLAAILLAGLVLIPTIIKKEKNVTNTKDYRRNGSRTGASNRRVRSNYR